MGYRRYGGLKSHEMRDATPPRRDFTSLSPNYFGVIVFFVGLLALGVIVPLF